MRWESAEITLHVIVYVPSPRPPSRGMTTLTSTTLASADTVAPASSSTAADPPVSDTCSLKRSTASTGASVITAPSGGEISSSSAWASAVPAGASNAPSAATRPATIAPVRLRSGPTRANERNGTHAEPGQTGDESGDRQARGRAIVTVVAI